MKRKNFTTLHDSARDVIDKVFSDPPLNETELRHRLSKVDPDAARRAILDRLEEQGVQGSTDDTAYSYVFDTIGFDEAVLDRLMRIVESSSLTALTRSVALTLLVNQSPQRAEAVMDAISQEELFHIHQAGMQEIIENAQYHPDELKALMEMIASLVTEDRLSMLMSVESCRMQAEIPAAVIYGPAMRKDELADLHSDLLNLFVKEGGPDSERLLEELLEEADDREWRKKLRKAQIRLRTRAIEPSSRPKATSKGTVYIGNCDGQGAFIMLACFPKNKNRYVVADLCIRAAADIRDGFVVPRLTKQEMKELIDEASSHAASIMVTVPLDVAVGIAKEGERRTRTLGEPIPEDAGPALSLLYRHEATDWRPHHDLEPASAATLDDYRKLLRGAPYHCWFFDAGDLTGAGITTPSRGKPSLSWYAESARRLEAVAIPARLAGMTEHMATWHALRGETKEARLCLAAARDVKTRFRESLLVQAMLEQSLGFPTLPLIDDTMIGDVHARGMLRELFFKDQVTPRGRDLARLDLTEVAFNLIDKVINFLPGERRPRMDDQYRIAFAVGAEFLRHIELRSKPEQIVEGLAEAIMGASDLTFDEVTLIFQPMLAGLYGFLQETCLDCPVACLDHPLRSMTEPFFSEIHPSRQTGMSKPSFGFRPLSAGPEPTPGHRGSKTKPSGKAGKKRKR